MRFVILSEKKWNSSLVDSLKAKVPAEWFYITKKEDFSKEKLQAIAPQMIFIPHWSYIISQDIYEQFDCVVFHMTDLPFGRGGSPLQNLIVRGFEKTKISALKITNVVDGGDIYLKHDLSLLGTAEEILLRANAIIELMITRIINEKLVATPQVGEAVVFNRRMVQDSDISRLEKIDQVYDYIRMLDADGYPKAFYENEHFRFEFSRASLKANKEIVADVRIIQK